MQIEKSKSVVRTRKRDLKVSKLYKITFTFVLALLMIKIYPFYTTYANLNSEFYDKILAARLMGDF
jgi:hypothetical protein